MDSKKRKHSSSSSASSSGADGGRDGSGGDWRRTAKKQSRKNQIRSVERSLRREGLPADIRASLVAKLQELQSAVVQKEHNDVERKRAQRYHKVKFFERQKVSRKLESARKKLDAIETAKHRSSSSKKQKRDAKSDDSSVAGNEASIRAEIEALEDDLTYIQYFPKDKKYLSLYSSRNANVEDERTNKLKAQMRVLARAAQKADEEKARMAIEAKAAKKKGQKHGGRSHDKKESASGSSESDDDDDDDGDDDDDDDDDDDGGSGGGGGGDKTIAEDDEEEDGAGFFLDS